MPLLAGGRAKLIYSDIMLLGIAPRLSAAQKNNLRLFCAEAAKEISDSIDHISHAPMSKVF
jgi:hypothetical protein